MSDLLSKTKKIGYYAGLVFGFGYSLTLLGYLVVFMSEWFKWYDPLFIVFSVLTLAGIICGIYLGITIGKNSKYITDSGSKIESISPSVYAYSLMLTLMGIGSTIIAALFGLFRPPDHWAGPGLPLHPFIASIVGPILLLIGFWVYRGQTPKQKLSGAIVMLVSVPLIYFIGWNFIGFVGSGMLLSGNPLEGIAVLIAAIGGIIFALPIRRREVKQTAGRIILSIGGIIFSFGVIYYIFSVISSLHFVDGFISIYISGHSEPPAFILGNLAILLGFFEGLPWIVFSGLIVIGISGVIGLIAACLSLGVSVKQAFAVRMEEEVSPASQEN